MCTWRYVYDGRCKKWQLVVPIRWSLVPPKPTSGENSVLRKTWYPGMFTDDSNMTNTCGTLTPSCWQTRFPKMGQFFSQSIASPPPLHNVYLLFSYIKSSFQDLDGPRRCYSHNGHNVQLSRIAYYEELGWSAFILDPFVRRTHSNALILSHPYPQEPKNHPSLRQSWLESI